MADLADQKGETDKANEYLFKAVQLGLQLGNQKKVAIILLTKGNKVFKEGDSELALSFFLNSLEIALSINAKPEIRDVSIINCSEVYYKLNDFEKAQEIHINVQFFPIPYFLNPTN